MDDEDIKYAFEKMTPSPGSEDRMRAALVSNLEKQSAPQKKKRKKTVKVVLPVAASLVLLAGIGLWTLGNTFETMINGGASPSAMSEAYSGSSGSSESKEVEIIGPIPGRQNSEEYASVDEEGFIPTKVQPLSTFSADVDTASYANLRRMINDGHSIGSIPQDAVRIEEMLNYFDYEYSQPNKGELFGTTATVADCSWNRETKLLIMGFSTEKIDYSDTEGSNLVFLIDTSGSMSSSNKLPLLQESFSVLLDQLSERDRVSIVTYSGEERVVCENVSANNREELQGYIEGLYAKGSTNGEAGLTRAYEIAEHYFIEGGNNRIILASDGDLNVGISSTDELYEYVSEKRDNGVYLSVLGFGTGNYKDAKMEVLADNGNGSYHYIDGYEEAKKVFEQDLCANLVTLAKDVKLQVEFNPDQVKAYRLIGYTNRAMTEEQFNDEAADAGEIGQGHQFTVAYELVLSDSDYEPVGSDLKYGTKVYEPTGSSEWLTCTMRYKDVDSEKSRETSFVVDEGSYTFLPGSDWTFAASVIQTGMLFEGSEYMGETTLSGIIETLESLNLVPGERQEFLDLLRKLEY